MQRNGNHVSQPIIARLGAISRKAGDACREGGPLVRFAGSSRTPTPLDHHGFNNADAQAVAIGRAGNAPNVREDQRNPASAPSPSTAGDGASVAR